MLVIRKLIMIAVAFAMLGCAAQKAYQEGQTLISQDKPEAGLAKLQEAMQKDPKNPLFKAGYIQARDRVVIYYLSQADRFAAASEQEKAEAAYRRALAIDPVNDRANSGLRLLERAARHEEMLKEAEAAVAKKDHDGARQKLALILRENPDHARARRMMNGIPERNPVGAAENALSSAYRKPITIEFKDASLKQVFEVISRTSGINFLFDKDVKSDQKTSIFLKNSTVQSAIYYTLITNGLEQQILDGNTIMIYPNTAAKLKEYQELDVRSFFLTNADAKAVANSLKTIVKSKDVVVDEKLNMVIMRDSPDAIRLAEKVVALHDLAEPEVMLEVEILEVNRGRLMELGIKWPDSLSLTPLAVAGGNSLTLEDLKNLNSRRLGASLSPLNINLNAEDANTNILANPRIRARNREKAKILIGDRVPNITTSATSTGFISESINYVDVGLKLDVEPTIYLDDEVAIKIALEVSNIVSQIRTQSGSLAYQIGTRTASTVLRLRDGENQVLAGLISDEDRRTASKIPGVGDVPVVGRLFGSTTDDKQKTEIVLSITPRLVRNINRPDAVASQFRAGTESSYRQRPETGGGAAVVSVGPVLPSGAAGAAGRPLTGQRGRIALPSVNVFSEPLPTQTGNPGDPQPAEADSSNDNNGNVPQEQNQTGGPPR